MADPLSFVASVVAVTTLAENVVTKGYRYLKAVKNCPGEVRNLMAEASVLCGILGRLKILLESNRSKSRGGIKSVNCGGSGLNDDHDEDDSVTSEDEEMVGNDDGTSNLFYDFDDAFSHLRNHQALHPPDFIYECQKTLHQIELILTKFQHKDVQSTQVTASSSRFKASSFRIMKAKDLKWPLRKSDTMQLIEALERHKSTCTIALAENGLAGIHAVLEQTKYSNKCLENLRAKQEKLFDLCISEEQEKALAWLSPVSPASKLQEFRRERQSGTGRWLFDLSEFSAWLENSNNALWIYGIPGAGKTILSTLVVDEVLTRKRSSFIGTAYFYIRHDDRNSQVPSNILSSIISQLARQNTAALDDVVELHTKHLREGSLTTNLEDDDLMMLLFSISKYFMDTFIMIDGLDESGPAYDRDRKRLIDILPDLHRNKKCHIHTLIFSRDELDIRTRLIATDFQIVSIAAKSADLRLFVNAWLPSLEIQSETLKIEIVDTLVDEANGMFMWVRAQVDYMQRLPNDTEKRKALKSLPPDLPQTYVRIFEVIDSTYPVQTKKYILRVLKWLVSGPGAQYTIYYNTETVEMLTFHSLRQAICIENENDRFSDDEIPTEQQILGWLGCLVRTSKSRDLIELSHFTIKEFLTTDPENVSSTIAQRYLIKPEDINYLLEVCLICLMHDDFRSTKCSNLGEAFSFTPNHPLYKYAATRLCQLVRSSVNIGMNEKLTCMMRRFLSVPVHESFQLWDTYMRALAVLGDEDLSQEKTELVRHILSPLRFASMTGLVDQVRELLKLGLDSKDSTRSIEEEELGFTPLALALYSGNEAEFYIKDGIARIFCNGPQSDEYRTLYSERNLQIVRMLLNAGANVDQQLPVRLHLEEETNYFNVPIEGRVTPLVLSVACGLWQAASILLDAGANWDAVADEIADNDSLHGDDLCSVTRLLKSYPYFEEFIRRIVDFSGHRGLKDALERWQNLGDTSDKESQCIEEIISDRDNQSIEEIISDSTSSQERFVNAYQTGNWSTVRELLNSDSRIEINCNDEQGVNLLYCASVGNGDDLRYMMERGANPNLLTSSGCGALSKAVAEGCLENMSLLLENGADIELRDPKGWTPLLYAIWHGRHEMVKLLLNNGANSDAILDSGEGGIHLALDYSDIDMVSLLLERGVSTSSADNFGSTPLHCACQIGFEAGVEKLIETASESSDRINDDSLIWGTPLYAAAQRGFVSIVRKLLAAGAAIDKTGPGNILGSALMEACANGHCEMVKLLLSRGASLEVEGSRFQSAAGTARAFRQEPIIKILEEHAGVVHETENE